MKEEKVLVLGAYSALALKNAGFDVIVAGKRKSDNGFFKELDIAYYSIDITDKDAFSCLLDKGITIVINFTGNLPSRRSFDPDRLIKIITEATINIFEFMRKVDVKKIIFPTTPYDLFQYHKNGLEISAYASRLYSATENHSVYAITVRHLDIMITLEENDIESRSVWKPMHLQPVFKDCDYIDNGRISERLFNNGVCLPSNPKMTDDLNRVCDYY